MIGAPGAVGSPIDRRNGERVVTVQAYLQLGVLPDEAALTEVIIDLASQFGRYGYCRITALLRAQGWHVNAKRVARIWRQEGLRVPAKQPSPYDGHTLKASAAKTEEMTGVTIQRL